MIISMIRNSKFPVITHSRTRVAWMLASRLERLSADSFWAHQASGLRGALLRALEQAETGKNTEADWIHLDELTEFGFFILENGAREMIEK